VQLEAILREGVARNASDVHLKFGSHPIFRVTGNLIPWDEAPRLDRDTMAILIQELLGAYHCQQLKQALQVDAGYGHPELGRFRVNVFYQRGEMQAALRLIPPRVQPIRDLSLPPVIERIASERRGLVLVTGTTGSGKSTTLAAMVEHVNENSKRHIITLEDPIEYMFEDNQSIIEQREIGLDTASFNRGLKSVLRQDPDIIMIGEMRDSISFQSAISAADTGHLVLSTIHTTNAATSIGRILDFFPADERDTIRRQLSSTLRAVVCQRMVPTVEGKLTPAQEIMLNTPVIRKMIEENRLEKLGAAIETGRDDGMQNFNQALYDLVKAGKVTKEAALEKATNAQALEMMFQGIFLTSGSRILG